MKELLEKMSITVNKVSRFLIIIFFALAFLSTVYQVFSRFVLQNSAVQKIIPMVDFSIFNLSWIEEFIRYLFVWIVFLGIGVVYKNKEHAQVEILHHYIPGKFKKSLVILVEVVSSGVFLFLILYGWSILKFTSQQISPSMSLNMTFIYGAVLVCSIICLIHSIVNIIELVFEKVENSKIVSTVSTHEDTNIG